MVTIRQERGGDVPTREALLPVSYGPIRFSKTSERLREGRLPDLSFVATSSRRLVGTVRLWDVSAGPGRPGAGSGPAGAAAGPARGRARLPQARHRLDARANGAA